MESKGKMTVKARITNFFTRLIDRIDKKMEAKAKANSCCCKPQDKKNKTCCS